MNLDLTDVVLDPLFQDETGTLFLRRVLDSVTDQGLASENSKTIPLLGSVQAGGGSSVIRDPETGERASDTIQIFTTTRLYSGKPGRSADVVIWQKREYLVTSVQDWSNWGGGFVNATATLMRVLP